MITGDLAARLRVLIESAVPPLSVVHEIPSDLPRFEAGQRFTALIQNPLPDGSFRALVAGKTMTLALPESAKNGDVMELVVTGQKDAIVYARQANSSAQPTLNAGDIPKPVLSQTGQLISQLLTGRFGEPEPMRLAQGVSLLPTAPAKASELVSALKQAVANSGLFYESHLRQWVEGKMPLATLQQEPQAQQAPLSPESAAPASTHDVPEEHSKVPTGTDNKAPVQTQSHAATANAAGTGKDTEISQARASQLEAFAEQAGKPANGKNVAEPLMPVVQQQLETLATHQMSWQGQVWPGMQMQWDIVDPEQQQNRGSDEEVPRFWRSILRLNLPKLGDVQAQLVLGPQGVSVVIDTDSNVSAQRMRIAQTELHEALEAAGVPLINLQVSEHARA